MGKQLLLLVLNQIKTPANSGSFFRDRAACSKKGFRLVCFFFSCSQMNGEEKQKAETRHK